MKEDSIYARPVVPGYREWALFSRQKENNRIFKHSS